MAELGSSSSSQISMQQLADLTPPPPRLSYLDTLRDQIDAQFGFWVKDAWFEKLEKAVAVRMKATAITDRSVYLGMIASRANGRSELQELMQHLLICETSFHRNPPQFEAFKQIVLPELVDKRPTGPIRIASCGCSTGEEPYSLAVAALEVLPPYQAERIEIVGLDACRDALKKARDGVYADFQLREYSDETIQRWFDPVGTKWAMKNAPKSLVRFVQANLADPLPMTGIDLLFCRNVMIYFRKPTISRLMDNFHASMNSGAFLFLGHAESAFEYQQLFQIEHTDETFFFRRKSVSFERARI